MLAALLALAVLFAACGDDTSDSAAKHTGIAIVATTTILGDVAANVAGDAATVTVLLPGGADPHDYQASAKQVAQLVAADLVIANGLHLEAGLNDILETAESDGVTVLWVAEGLDPIPFGGGSDHAEGDHGDRDPHVWFDPARMAEAARLIAAELEQIDPAGGWGARADAYAGELLAADARIASILAEVPAENRKLVTSHNALGYFAQHYGFTVIGTIIPGGSTLAEPSSAEMAALAALIETEQVKAIFTETTQPADLADALAAEIGREVGVVSLYTGSLGEAGSGADTLIGMLTTNAERIAAALS